MKIFKPELNYLPERNPVDMRPELSIVIRTAVMLVISNCFMTFAWYGHLRNLNHKAWYIAALVSWGIALFEYLVQVPANRLGFTQMSLAQLKILQEAVTLGVFIPFAILYMKKTAQG
jgi:uncharacterized protein (DUF486 family)